MRTLDDVVDDLGLGFGQYIVVLLGGELYSGLIKTLVTSCSVAFASDLGFSATERGWMVSTLFLGNFAGNLSSGAISDCCGRRFTILVGYLVGVSALLASLLTSDFTGQLACRTGYGLAAGLMGPTSWTLLGELAPSKRRLWLHSLSHLTWFLGAIFMLSLIHFEDPSMQHVPWHTFTAYTFSITIVCMMMAMHFIVESPSHLCLQRRRNDAISVLETLQRRNGVHVDVQNWELRLTEVYPSVQQKWSYMALFDRTSLFTTMTLSLCTFTLNFSGYGMMYAGPIIFAKSKLGVPSVTMMVSFFCGLLGIASGVPASGASQSRPRFIGYILIARATCVSLLLCGLWLGEVNIVTVVIALVGMSGKTFLDSIAYMLVYLYAIEVRPTESRASGSAFALGVGRLGAVLAPIVFEMLKTPTAFVASVFVLGLLCASLVFALPLETKDRQLGEIADEVSAIRKSPGTRTLHEAP
mmetsp:Transcript_102844/g.187767  ORF Transcript_102844/g.187767 Transcript_102844/m.187767 type:complete len:469 (+) Transcript_102844:63-1469(+)